MVQAYFTDKDKGGVLRVDINGHANLKNAEGLDVLCACCTTLANTLALNVKTFEEAGMLKSEPVIYLGENGDGKARISCVPNEMYYAVVRTAFTAIIIGFEMLSRYYPSEVEFVKNLKK